MTDATISLIIFSYVPLVNHTSSVLVITGPQHSVSPKERLQPI